MTRSPIASASGARTGVRPCREGAESSDHFTDDPDDPAPTCAGNNLTLPSGVADQRAVETRADVGLHFGGAGPPARSDGAHPRNAVGRLLRGRYGFHGEAGGRPPGRLRPEPPGRDHPRALPGFAQRPVADHAGPAHCYTIDLWATSIVFLPGRRIRLEISSSNFPRFDRNLNTGAPFGEGVEYRSAETVLHEAGMAFCVHIPVIPR